MPLAVLFNHRVLVVVDICVPRLCFNAAFEPNPSGLGARKETELGSRENILKRPDAFLSPDGDGVGQSLHAGAAGKREMRGFCIMAAAAGAAATWRDRLVTERSAAGEEKGVVPQHVSNRSRPQT